MEILLIFFALPIAIIIISIALQKVLKCPILVAGIIFSIFLIISIIFGSLILVIVTIIYTIISFLTAAIFNFIQERFNNCMCSNNMQNCCDECNNQTRNLLTISSQCNNSNNGNLLRISSNNCNGVTNDLLTINSNCSERRNNGCNNGDTSSLNGILTISDNGFFDNNTCRSCRCNCNNGRCGCNNCENCNNCNTNNNNRISARVNVIPNSETNGRTGCFCGRYRR